MREANTLTKEELVAVVKRIQKALYGEERRDDKGRTRVIFDRNKVWDSDTITEVDEVLVDADLSPENPEE